MSEASVDNLPRRFTAVIGGTTHANGTLYDRAAEIPANLAGG
ncbi:hypothetical protein QVN06_25265 (plasmid) [Escherichia coli]|nr:hypothetical protein [Escherichia coli]WJV92356.1 hypothetical protein QVN06_25265 [Escherichia coli]